MSNGRLDGKVAIVTGSGSGIGRGIARLFAAEKAKVAVVDMNGDGAQETVDLIKKDRERGNLDPCNVLSSSEVKAFIVEVVEKYGRLNVLHNNVGGWQRGSRYGGQGFLG